MRVGALHRWIGLILALPFVVWAVTGLIFFIKPGYSMAYALLQPKLYPLDQQFTLPANPEWLEYRLFKTVLGDHLMVRTEAGWNHLDPLTLRARKPPDEAALRLLIEDAITTAGDRYGRVVNIDKNTAITDSGIRISVDWQKMSLTQRGGDTDLIDLLYRLHYLQWTGNQLIDRGVGMLGLMLVLALTFLGLSMAVGRRREG